MKVKLVFPVGSDLPELTYNNAIEVTTRRVGSWASLEEVVYADVTYIVNVLRKTQGWGTERRFSTHLATKVEVLP